MVLPVQTSLLHTLSNERYQFEHKRWITQDSNGNYIWDGDRDHRCSLRHLAQKLTELQKKNLHIVCSIEQTTTLRTNLNYLRCRIAQHNRSIERAQLLGVRVWHWLNVLVQWFGLPALTLPNIDVAYLVEHVRKKDTRLYPLGKTAEKLHIFMQEERARSTILRGIVRARTYVRQRIAHSRKAGNHAPSNGIPTHYFRGNYLVTRYRLTAPKDLVLVGGMLRTEWEKWCTPNAERPIAHVEAIFTYYKFADTPPEDQQPIAVRLAIDLEAMQRYFLEQISESGDFSEQVDKKITQWIAKKNPFNLKQKAEGLLSCFAIFVGNSLEQTYLEQNIDQELYKLIQMQCLQWVLRSLMKKIPEWGKNNHHLVSHKFEKFSPQNPFVWQRGVTYYVTPTDNEHIHIDKQLTIASTESDGALHIEPLQYAKNRHPVWHNIALLKECLQFFPDELSNY